MESGKKIILCDGLNQAGKDLLANTPGIEVDDRTSISRDELIRVIDDYHGMIVRSRTQVDGELLAFGKKLEVVGTGRYRY